MNLSEKSALRAMPPAASTEKSARSGSNAAALHPVPASGLPASRRPPYPAVKLHIDGRWRPATGGETLPVLNPATGEEIGTVPAATHQDLDEALAAAQKGFGLWRETSAFDRYKIMRNAANVLRGQVEQVAAIMTLEQGKILAEARAEVLGSADIIDWFAEEGRRAYGRVVPARSEGIMQLVLKEPVGPVAAFTPWNFPIAQAVRKLSAALCAGCPVILKGPENAPASCSALVRSFLEAGVPGNVLGLVFGNPGAIANYLIASPIIRKISFTGSTQVGKELAALAGLHMKRATMELGGHAPAIVFQDADIEKTTRLLGFAKYRNAGQVCVAPSRVLVHESVYQELVGSIAGYVRNLQLGDGLDPSTTMGPLAHERRVVAMERFVADARRKGAKALTGGARPDRRGFFFQPTVLVDVPRDALLMNEEPFGPITAVSSFRHEEEAYEEANRLPYGLAAYAYTRSADTASRAARRVECGMMSINHNGLGLPENPFGGIKDSGYGSEGGPEAVEAYLNTRFVSQTGFS